MTMGASCGLENRGSIMGTLSVSIGGSNSKLGEIRLLMMGVATFSSSDVGFRCSCCCCSCCCSRDCRVCAYILMLLLGFFPELYPTRFYSMSDGTVSVWQRVMRYSRYLRLYSFNQASASTKEITSRMQVRRTGHARTQMSDLLCASLSF